MQARVPSTLNITDFKEVFASAGAGIKTDVQENHLKLEVEEDILTASKSNEVMLQVESPPIPCWNYIWFYFSFMKNRSGLSKTYAAQTIQYDEWLLF